MSEPIQRPGLFGVRVRLLFVALACVIISVFLLAGCMRRECGGRESVLAVTVQEINSRLQREKEAHGKKISQWLSNENELMTDFVYEQKKGMKISFQKKIDSADLDYIILVSMKPDPGSKKPYSIFEHAFRDESHAAKVEAIIESHMANPKQLVERVGLWGFTEEVLLYCEMLEADKGEAVAGSANDGADVFDEKADAKSPPMLPKKEQKKCVAGYLLVGMKPANKVTVNKECMSHERDSRESPLTAKVKEINSTLIKERETYGRNICHWMSSDHELELDFLYRQKSSLRIYLQKKMALADLDYMVLVSKKPDPASKKPYSIFERVFRDEGQSATVEAIVESHMANPKQIIERDGLLGFAAEVLLPCSKIEIDANGAFVGLAKDEGELMGASDEKTDGSCSPKPAKEEIKQCLVGYLLVGMKSAKKINLDL